MRYVIVDALEERGEEDTYCRDTKQECNKEEKLDDKSHHSNLCFEKVKPFFFVSIYRQNKQ